MPEVENAVAAAVEEAVEVVAVEIVEVEAEEVEIAIEEVEAFDEGDMEEGGGLEETAECNIFFANNYLNTHR